MRHHVHSTYRDVLLRIRCAIHRSRLAVLGLAILGIEFFIPFHGAQAQLSAERNLRIFQADLGGSELVGDRFGAALAVGHFNNDAFLDLAIGAPGKAIGGDDDAGIVYVTYGSAFGLGLGPSAAFFQDRSDLEDSSEADDQFGASLAVADFDGDGFDDLAVGVPGEQIGVASEAGAVHIIFGSSAGLSSARDQFLHQDTAGIEEVAGSGDRFGHALVAGNFDNNAFADLAIGIPGEDLGFTFDSGAVSVLFGDIWGLSTADDLLLSDDEDDGDQFGWSLAAADRTGDGRDDLIVGVPGEESVSTTSMNVGIVMIGISTGDSFIFSSGFIGSIENEGLGSSVAAGDLDNDGQFDVFAGAPDHGAESTGRVLIFDEVTGGLDSLAQGAGGLYEEAEPFDRFGTALASGDFDNDGYADMVIGVPVENLFDDTPDVRLDAGLVQIIRGGDSGLDSINNQVWHLGVGGLGTQPASNGNFGAALATGDFDGDGHSDLAIGAPNETGLSITRTGLVQILYSRPALFLDNFESGNTAAWSVVVNP